MFLKIRKFVTLQCFVVLVCECLTFNFSDVQIPQEHYPYYFYNFRNVANLCLRDKSCHLRNFINSNACWGYEKHCLQQYSYSVKPSCDGDHKGWVKTKEAQIETFYTQADFGYVKQQIDELMVLCEPSTSESSSLECTKYLRFCRGRNLMLNFTSLKGRGDNLRYKIDILGNGQIGGNCILHKDRLEEEAMHMSPLQSWAPEMSNFVQLEKQPSEQMCDEIIETPTFIMKLDATVNMYHHFCDFFNLYATLHINSSHPNMFSKNNQIVIWETYTYRSAFSDAWKAFTNNPIWDLKKFRGKVICFKNVVFPLVPRMIFGLYYNTPLIGGCERSGLFHAFSTHMLHSLGVKKESRTNDNVKITLLSRGTTHRRILNENELLAALKPLKGIEVQRVVFDYSVPFTSQVNIVHNSDVLIGMHGAGLTHLLFLPDWAAVFEIYHCEDPACYSDLTRLRGLKYLTWEDSNKVFAQDQGQHPEGGAHAKFTNYKFDVDEFSRLVQIAVNHVINHEDFKTFLVDNFKHKKDEL